MADRKKIILPPKYYLDYFQYLLDFILQGSAHLLGDDDRFFLQIFDELSEDAKCVMVRMMNRKGEFFRLDKFEYEEINNIPQAVEELEEAGMVSLDPPHDFVLFTLLTKGELHQLYADRLFNKKKKDEVIFELAEENNPSDYKLLLEKYPIMQFLQQEQIEYFKLLFFGHAHGMMTEFVIRDIGNVKLENLDNHTFTPWFDTAAEARAVFELYKWDRTIRQTMQVLLPEEVLQLVDPVDWGIFFQHPKSRKIGDKLMLRLGEYFEKTGLPAAAISFYELAKKHPARERRIRILEKMENTQAARELAEMVVTKPYNATELMFARDFLGKKGKRTNRSTTTKINESEEILITNPIGERVEMQALAYFAERGFDGAHTENYLWRALFGLLFWEELFDHQHASFHHPLQRMPSDLRSEGFFNNRAALLSAKTKKLKSKKQLLDHLTTTHDLKNGISNHLVSWHESLLPTIRASVKHLPLEGLYAVMMEIAKNVKDNSAGFPDLFVWNKDTYHFYEIKSPNDHLSAQQMYWIEFLTKHKIKAEILRVKYG